MLRPRFVLVYCTVPSPRVGKKIARALLEKQLVACANILGKGVSLYHWKGQIEQADEAVLLMKTTAKNFTKIEKAILTLHPYDCPYILRIAIDGGSKSIRTGFKKRCVYEHDTTAAAFQAAVNSGIAKIQTPRLEKALLLCAYFG